MTEVLALQVAQQAWECWVAADLDGFIALWDEDGVWTNAGHSRISGPRQGHQAIGDVARTVFELSGGTFKAHPVELVASGDNTVLGRFHMVAERDGVVLDQDGMQRMVVRGGKLVTLDNLFSDERAMDDFFA
jgi:ketosteroid isomerase-like protein